MADTTPSVRNPIASVPIEITVSVGKARPHIRDLMALEENAILPLDSRINDPVELYIGDQLIARSDLQEIPDDPSGQLSVRLTQVIDVSAMLL